MHILRSRLTEIDSCALRPAEALGDLYVESQLHAVKNKETGPLESTSNNEDDEDEVILYGSLLLS